MDGAKLEPIAYSPLDPYFNEIPVILKVERVAPKGAPKPSSEVRPTETRPAEARPETRPTETRPTEVHPEVTAPQIYHYTPLFALKTNLLFDLALTPNIELEVPIGKRWSVNGEFMRGWWLNKSNTFCWQVESFGLEGRYWFGNRDNRRVLTGWFAGTFVSGGFYDFQLQKTKGIQGEFFILAGFSGGYSYKINRSLSLELSAGVGYVMNDYRHYEVEDDGLYRSSPNYRFQSILPAKAKVSLVWLIHSRKPLVTIGGESR